jgi:hypothetical protein
MRYRLVFEIVDTNELHRYANADPRYYSNTTQMVPNSEIPNEHWRQVDRESDDIEDLRDQYDKLKEWHDGDEGYVRNPRIEQMPTGEWTEVQL